MSQVEKSAPPIESKESQKRRREFFIVLGLGVVFLLLTWVEIRLFSVSHELPFVHSIFFFGLVNFNIILLLLLFFLIFRNVVKVFVERKGRLIGSSLKGKLVAAFVAFSFFPTMLMFIISVFYINNSFEKWFSMKMTGILKSSLEVTNEYYTSAKKKNYHFAQKIARSLKETRSRDEVKDKIVYYRRLFSLDAVEYYPNLFGRRVVEVSGQTNIPDVPRANLEFLQKGVKFRTEGSTIHQFADGNLVRVIVPIGGDKDSRALVVSGFVPLSLISKMHDISSAYEDFRDLDPLEYPLKSIYLIILFLMTMVILLCATWFGFHLAKQLSIPLVSLGKAARFISAGKYQKVNFRSGSKEITSLVESFNMMSGELEKSQGDLKTANENLQHTLLSLDEHSRYLEFVLSNISTGVITADKNGLVTSVNQHAKKLLKRNDATGRFLSEIFDNDGNEGFADLLRSIKEYKIGTIQREVSLNIQGEMTPFQMNLTILRDEEDQEMGMILVFDDLTILVNAQRAAAWRDVARRIAHEIKNPLTPIRLSAQRLSRKFGKDIDDPAFSACTGMIIRQTDALKEMVNEFSSFARLPQAKPVPSSLNKIVEDGMVLYKTAHKRVRFKFKKDESLPEFKFDPEQLNRVLVNLIDNSVAALKQEKSPWVEIVTFFDKSLKIVRLSLSDNGRGIPKGQRQRIFDPYFSTKHTGTGLGLAIVKRIIEDHNGFIRAFSNKPKGTRIVIELPVVEARPWEMARGRGSKGKETENESTV